MVLIVVVLLLVLVLGGFGFAFHLFWFLAALLLVAWLLGFVLRGSDSGGSRSRWYRW